MKLKFLLSLCLTIGITHANRINIINNCPFTVWPGILGSPNFETPENGGFQLDAGQSREITTQEQWSGRMWGRTGCDESGHCVTGDCGNKIECAGAGGVPPVTLGEWTFDDPNVPGVDFYDVSLVDGFNLPMRITPTGGNEPNGGGPYDCTSTGCPVNINDNCPGELQQTDGGSVVACKSACEAFNDDVYCCRGEHNQPETCRSSDWPVNYPQMFKDQCPEAYSYAYDDNKSTFTCKRSPSPSYDVTFCP
ncbi:pathogenesis-related thaumatin-like protein 3.5 [Aphidius gifuensis]|uniref:pathogenesis-related thaumatin-like protein 3.5 n=1 Tax=Aphidius gifuensis TaxID=684658 RepID=UPI001CDCE660|nr:pathogenesis-related thaumatin-like protein 3.5 [Aphidius gifuensis]